MNITQATIDFIRKHANDDVRRLALSAKRTDGLDLPFALDQIAGKQMAKTKLPEWYALADVIFPPHISMEQCSSESTARYKRKVLMTALGAYGGALNDRPSDRTRSDENASATHGRDALIPAHFVDITGGFGVDFSYMARGFEKATYVERQTHLCDIARHNFPLLGLPSSEVLCEELETPLGLPFVKGLRADLERTYIGLRADNLTDNSALENDADTEKAIPLVFFMDPARRDTNGNRTYAIADCTPNVIGFIGDLLEKAALVMIKLSPMLDWHQTIVDLNRASHSGNAVREVHIVSTQNECKELLIVLSERKNQHAIKVFCVNDDQEFSFSVYEENNTPSPLTPHLTPTTHHPSPTTHLLVPNASIMKAGCFEQLEKAFSIRQIGRNSHLFVGDVEIMGFPGRIFEVLKITTMNKKELKTALKGIESANIATRNFPLSPEQLRKRLKLKDGGDIYLFATTTDENEHVIYVCKR